MRNYQPTFETRETAQNIKFFIDANMGLFWSIVKPLVPYILALYLMDSVVTALYMPDSKSGFSLGSFLASYFLTVIAISWHRVVILGPDNFVPMDPFRPKKHELVFIGMGLLIATIMGVGSIAIVGLSLVFGKVFAVLGVFVALIFVFYFIYKFSFYFPAKAVDAGITLKQSFYLTRGYFWKIIIAPLRASAKLILMLFGYMIVLFFVLFFVFFSSEMQEPQGGLAETIIYLWSIPVIVYFQPLMTVIGVTSLSNYYMHAMQNRNDSVTNL